MTAPRRPRVVVNALSATTGGGSTYAANLVAALARLDVDLVVVAPPTLGAWPPGVRIERPFAERPALSRRFAWEQLRLPRRHRSADGIISTGGVGLVLRGRRQVVVHHNALHFQPLLSFRTGRERLRLAVERSVVALSWASAGAVIVLSHAARESMLRAPLFAPLRGRVHVSQSAVPVRGAAEAGFDLDCETCRRSGYVLTVANWYPHKGLPVLLDGVRLARPSLPWPHLVVVGGDVGHPGTPEVTAALREPATHWVGQVAHADLQGLYAGARALVSAATVETFPLTPLEALQARVVPVLSDIAAHREVAGACAEYFRAGDPCQLAVALQRAAHEDRRQEILSGAPRQLAKFSWERHARDLLSHLGLSSDGGGAGAAG